MADSKTGMRRQDLCRQGLPILRLKRKLPYLTMDGAKRRVEHLQVFYALLPQYRRKRLLGKGYQAWSREEQRAILQKTAWRAERELDCRESIWSWDEDLQEDILSPAADGIPELPMQLYAAYLYSLRPFEQICITLPEDCGGCLAQQLKELLLPYLPRIRKIAYDGEKSCVSEELEDFFYQEYGTLMQNIQTVPEEMIRLDFRTVWKNTLKFLDTRIKSGYNTEVNWGLLQTITKT